MKSTMVTLVEEYLSYRRKLGFQLETEGAQLLRFARYADQIGHQGPMTTKLAVEWAKNSPKASALSKARRLDAVRRFAHFRALFDPLTEVPPRGLLGPAYRRLSPYIYSQEEISALIEAASELGPVGGLRPHTYATLFGLLASSGLRISEALALQLQDVDLNEGTLKIRAGKFKKARLIPLHPSTISALQSYSKHRDQYHPDAKVAAFFLTEHATPLKYHKTLMTFLTLRTRLGWIRQDRNSRPRIHDLRHTFAVRCLLGWYQQGLDIEQKLPALANYLGHVKVSDTYWYLTAVPELLACASSRFQKNFDRSMSGGD